MNETPSRSSRGVSVGEPLSGADTLREVPSSVTEISPYILSRVSQFPSHTSLLYWSLVKDGALPSGFAAAFE